MDSNSLKLLRYVGYVLLILALFDLIEMLIPLRLMNPIWEFQTFGFLIDRIIIPLLGFMLVFQGGKDQIARWKRHHVLKYLSYTCFLFGVILLILIPLMLTNTYRIAADNNIQTAQLNPPLAQIQKTKERLQKTKKSLQKVKTKQDLEVFLKEADIQVRSFPKEDSQVEKVKKQIQQLIASTERKIKQAEESMVSQNQNQDLWKTSLKWNLQALVSAIMFFIFFKNTHWLRRKRKKSF